MARNYYVILGVEPDASADQIKAAYRCKAMQLHPDHYEGDSKPFRDLQEAYETLNDPARRQVYDAGQARERRARAASQSARGETLRPRRCPVEPLVPGAPPVGFPGPLRQPPGASPAERLDRRWDRESRWPWPTPPALDPDAVVISLTQNQAQRGGRVRVWLAIQTRCPNCRGTGRVGLYVCWECSGEGAVVEQRPVWLVFPAGVTDGTAARVSLAQLGMPDAHLGIRFRVRGV